METIIGLLFILLPVIFKLIGKKFEQSGQTDKAGKMRELAKALESDEDSEDSPFKGFFDEKSDPEVGFDDDGQIVEIKPVPLRQKPVPVVMPKAARPLSKRSVLLEEETSKRKGEKIDPKKLVIYSEIMKPKF
ncbi:MAG: hypothetical protein IJ971_03900 [Bacteroidales bacterium]|nr:hypothetical protein [Bacteroidales bacterium]